jgi:hypothetical protein
MYQYPQLAFKNLGLDSAGEASIAGLHTSNPPPTGVGYMQSPSTASTTLSTDVTIPEEDPDTVIGSVLKSGRLTCNNPQCTGKSFGRQAELNRHYDTTHAAYKPHFWCPVAACRRSAGFGIRSFPRVDKLRNHIESMHGAGMADVLL